MKADNLIEYKPHVDKCFMAEKLLSCPCCGCKAKLYFEGNPSTNIRSAVIQCTHCGLKRKDSTIRNDAEWAAKVAIAQWNKRV